MKKRSYLCLLLVFVMVLSPMIVVDAGSTKSKSETNSWTSFQDLKPMYNVSKNKEFVINFKSDVKRFYSNMNLTHAGYIKVFTDPECKNQIYPDIVETSKYSLTIKPPTVYGASRLRKGIDFKSEKERTWGGYEKYYLVISRDTKATTFKELDEPLRMMFTVESAVQIPTVSFQVNREGLAELSWNPVAGATEYKIYKGGSPTAWSVNYFASTKDTKFTDFALKGFASSTPSNPDWVNSTNQEFRGTFFVTAVVGGKESRMGNDINADQYAKIVPQYMDISSYMSLRDISELPTVTAVRMMDYNTIKNYAVIWDYDNIKQMTGKFGGTYYNIKGSVPGTAFKLEASFDNQPEAAVLDEQASEQDKINENNGVTEVKDKIADAPPPVKTPTDTTKPSKPADISTQIPKTPEPATGVEAAIANALMGVQTKVNLAAYPETGDSSYLRDVLYKVMVQTPLALYESSFGYDYATSTLLIEYNKGTTKEAVQKKQAEIKAKVKQVVAEVIKPGMTDYDKEKALHDWLCKNTVYDFEALEIAEKNGFSELPAGHEDSFNPYGVLINGVGVCQSYAEAFKLLCEEAKLPCVVITGKMNGVPHAWNMVKLGGMYYHVDATNNDNDIPYPVFNSSDKDIKLDYTITDEFALNSEMPGFASTNSKYDYYVLNGMAVTSKSEIKTYINKAISGGGEAFSLKLVDFEMSAADLRELIQEILNNSTDRSLQGMRMGRFGSVLFGMFKR